MLGESHDHFWSRNPWGLAGFDVHGNQKESVGMYSSSAIRMRFVLWFLWDWTKNILCRFFLIIIFFFQGNFGQGSVGNSLDV